METVDWGKFKVLVSGLPTNVYCKNTVVPLLPEVAQTADGCLPKPGL